MSESVLTKAILESFRRRRTPLGWASLALTLIGVWLVLAVFIMVVLLWVPQTRTEWLLLILLGPPSWFAVDVV